MNFSISNNSNLITLTLVMRKRNGKERKTLHQRSRYIKGHAHQARFTLTSHVNHLHPPPPMMAMLIRQCPLSKVEKEKGTPCPKVEVCGKSKEIQSPKVLENMLAMKTYPGTSVTLNMEGMLSVIEVLHVGGELPLDLIKKGGFS